MKARTVIARAGGLANLTDLANQWGVSKQRVSVLAKQQGFPEPVGTVGGRPVWLVHEATQWRTAQKGN